jgi:hypothetical protein
MFFANTEQLYQCAEALFEQIQQQEPRAADKLIGSRLVIYFRCTEPAGEITINARQRPLQTSFGPSKVRPDLEIELMGDTLHQILLGKLSLAKAVGGRLLKVKGPVWKTAALADLFERGQSLYPQILKEKGLTP